MNIIPEDINELLLTNIEIIIFVYFYFKKKKNRIIPENINDLLLTKNGRITYFVTRIFCTNPANRLLATFNVAQTPA